MKAPLSWLKDFVDIDCTPAELEEKLLLEFNKSRQASITQEITEISGAANAIK